MWNQDLVNSIVASFRSFLKIAAHPLAVRLDGFQILLIPEGKFQLAGGELIPAGGCVGAMELPAENGVWSLEDSNWINVYFFVRNSQEVYVDHRMISQKPSAFLASLLHVLVSLDRAELEKDLTGDRFLLRTKELELPLLRWAENEYDFEFSSERGQARLKIDLLIEKLVVWDAPSDQEEKFRYEEYLVSAKERIDIQRPDASSYKRAALANTLASLLVSIDISNGYGGPSVREHLACSILSTRVWKFHQLFNELNKDDGLIFGPLLQAHHEIWAEYEGETIDDDPDDLEELESGWDDTPADWRPDWN